MKIYYESYERVMQSGAGGVPMRIKKMLHYSDSDYELKLFDKWNDKIQDCDILHVFKANIDNHDIISYAKKMNKKVVISSVVEQNTAMKILAADLVKKTVRINSTYTFLENSLRLADAIIAQTQKEADFIAKNYKIKKNKLYVIPNGVNEALFKLSDDVKKKDIVLNVGRFNSNKNQLALIQAMKDTDIPVYFIGGQSPEDKSYYDACLKEAEHSKNIHFAGFLQSDDRLYLQLFERAKVITLLSYNEVFGNALLEGGAAGANMVATNVLPVAEWGLDKACMTVSPSNISEIRSAVTKAYSEKTDASIRKNIHERFSWDKVAEEYKAVYSRVMKHE